MSKILVSTDGIAHYLDLKPTGATNAEALKEDWERAERMAALFKGLS